MSQVGSPPPDAGCTRTGTRRPSPSRVIDTVSGHVLPVEASAVRAAALLRAHGAEPGQRVLVKAGNSVEYVAAVLALVHLDASVVLVDHEQTVAETHRVAAFVGVDLALLDDPGQAPDGIPCLSPRLLAEVVREPSDGPPEAFRADRWRARTDALVLWSSGSTGEPKAVVKSGRAFLENLERTCRLMRYREDDVLLPLLPFSHQYGLSLVFLAWLTGASLLIAPHTRPDRALAAGGVHGATVVDATPATYRSVVSLARRRPRLLAGLDGVRLWCTGGAPMDGELGRQFRAATGAPLLDGYGSTEVGNVAYATPDHPDGCGRLLDGIELWIVGEDGRQLPSGEVGEVRLHTPDFMEGYLTDRGDVAPVSTAEPYRTGDLGYQDAAGNLHVLGRKYAVHRLGHTLYPEVLERKAEACGRPVKIVPMADARRGHELVFVVEDPSAGRPLQWRRRICALLPPFEQPNHVLVVPRFPVNHNGKTDVPALVAHVHRTLFDGATVRTAAERRTGTQPLEDGNVPSS